LRCLNRLESPTSGLIEIDGQDLAAMSLAQLYQNQDRQQEAHDALAPVYESFTEGFDTTDLREARALIAELS